MSSGAGGAGYRVERRADYRRTKHLGHWTTARAFDIHARYGAVVLDLCSPCIPPGDIDIAVEADHSLVKLLVPEGAAVDDRQLRGDGRGKAEDYFGHPAPGSAYPPDRDHPRR